MAEDAAFLLIDSLDNLPSELQNLYEDIRVVDVRTTDAVKKIKTRDAQIGKFIKASGSLERNVKEDLYYPKIRADFGRTLEKSYEKEALAKKALELLDRTLRKLDDETRRIVALERSGGSSHPYGTGLSTGQQQPAGQYQHERSASSARGGGVNGTGVHGSNGGAAGGSGGAAGEHGQSLMPGQNTPFKQHKRARSTSTRPSVPSGLGGPPLLPNGYPAPPPPSGGSDEEAGEDTTTYCFCEQVSYGEMVACDNDSCEREWFHYGCVGLKEPPIGKWYCSECIVKKDP